MCLFHTLLSAGSGVVLCDCPLSLPDEDSFPLLDIFITWDVVLDEPTVNRMGHYLKDIDNYHNLLSFISKNT